MEKLIATLLANPCTKGIAALFILAEIYNVGIIPGWYGTLELKKSRADLEIATQKANNAEQRFKAEAEGVAAQVAVKLAEAKNALVNEKALADTAEAEAITAEQTAIPSPELQKAKAEEATAEGKIQLGRAAAARDQAKADADFLEQEANRIKGDMQLARDSADAQIAQSLADRQKAEQGLRMFIGDPLPDLTPQ